MKKFLRITSTLLAMCLFLALPASAESTSDTRASLYFAAHDCFLRRVDSSTFKICFDVTATGMMTVLGVSEIEVERSADGVNWTTIRTYDADDYPQMLCENTSTHDEYITYRYATPGHYYRAYITFYAKNNSGTGKRQRYTAVMQL